MLPDFNNKCQNLRECDDVQTNTIGIVYATVKFEQKNRSKRKCFAKFVNDCIKNKYAIAIECLLVIDKRYVGFSYVC